MDLNPCYSMTNAMTNAMTDATINTAYAVEMEERSQAYPAIQASCYQPSTMSQKVDLVLSEESYQFLLPAIANDPENGIEMESLVCNYGDQDVEMLKFSDDARFVVLAMPRLFGFDKTTGDISPLQKGEKLAITGRRTVSRVLLAVVHGADQRLVVDEDGLPQIFTLKLTSSKTMLIGSARDTDKDSKTIFRLNKALQEHYKQKNAWLTHLVSVKIQATPATFQSSSSKESSKGVKFVLVGDAKVLPEPVQKQIFDLITTDEFKELAKNPFGVRKDNLPPEDGDSNEAIDEDVPIAF